jgi:hypothetical protein
MITRKGKHMTGKEKIEKIIGAINAGHTVYFSNHLKTWKMDSKILKRFENAGYDLFKTDKDNHILMLSGKKYVIMDYCKITFV